MRKLVIINGSPRGEKGATGVVVKDMEGFIPKDMEAKFLCFSGDGLDESLDDSEKEALFEADILLFAFPLYVDTFPSNLLYCLRDVEKEKAKFKNGSDIKVYAFVNCGLYEGFQSAISIEILKNWIIAMDFKFGMAVGFGGCGALPGAKKQLPGEGIKEDMPRLFTALFNAMENGETDKENLYGNIAVSREDYKNSSEAGWRKLVVRNGLEEKDLDRQY